MTDIRITVQNMSGTGGTYLTPVWAGFHDGSFDLFDAGHAASAGLEQLAEDGNFAGLGAEITAADSDALAGAVLGAAGPIDTGETASAVFSVDGAATGALSLGAMILPSNDAFIGTDDAVILFDEDGNFLGPRRLTYEGSDVLDAGTEVNTELDAAFINQTGPDTGIDENGVIRRHDGFNGASGNTAPEGDQIILGGTNAFGDFIDPTAADFTLPGSQIARVHINVAETTTGSDDADRVIGSAADDLVNAGHGDDLVIGKAGWDEIDGNEGNDKLLGMGGVDILSGGTGNDLLKGGVGQDHLTGGDGIDTLQGGRGADSFVFSAGDGDDVILDFGRGADVLVLDIDGIVNFDDVLATASIDDGSVTLDFEDDGSILLLGTRISDLSEGDFAFA